MPDTVALLRDAPWWPVLAALLFVWFTLRLNVIGSFYPYAYDKRCVPRTNKSPPPPPSP